MNSTISTLKDATHRQWVADVLKSDAKLASDVAACGIKPETILTPEMHKQLGFLQYTTAVVKGVADLKRVVYEMRRKESAIEISGILAGMRDVYGTGQPVRFAILKKDGRHVEVSSFDTRLPMEGTKVSLSVPSQVTIAADYDEEYNSYNAVSLVSHAPISKEMFMNALNSVAKSPGKIRAEDKGSVVVIRGVIQYVNPAPRWKNRAFDGEEIVWQMNQRRTPQGHPVLRLKLYEENTQVGGAQIPVSVSATISHMKNVVPIVEIPDLAGMCQYAVTAVEDPRDQARMVQDVVQGREVLIVGRVSSYEPKPDKTYVNLDVHTVYQVDGPKPTGLESAEPEPEPEPEPVEESEVDLGGFKEAVGSVFSEPPELPGTSPAAQVVAYLDAIVAIVGVKPSDLDSKQIWEEKFKDKMSFEVFDTIVDQYKKNRRGTR